MTSPGSFSAPVTAAASAVERVHDAGGGVLRLAPAWVPRVFCTPGRRLRLHPDDYYPFGKGRGGIDERWLASTVRADNGPETGEHEGLSMVVGPGAGSSCELIPLDAVVEHLRERAVGPLWQEYGGWPMYAKFFDNAAPLPFHLHHRPEHAALVGKRTKPEAYFFPVQMNPHLGEFPLTFFGLHPEVSREQVAQRLRRFVQGGDNRITELSRAYRVVLGTGWDVPAGVLHAPASVCTYEPQAASDVFAMAESWSNHQEVPAELMWKDVPEKNQGDVEFILDLIDWEVNQDPLFFSRRFTPAVETAASAAAGPGSSYAERWVSYRSEAFSAKELTVTPGATVMVQEAEAYGLIALSGRGTLNGQNLVSASQIRYGQLTYDEFFITSEAAARGVRVVNTSLVEDLVILKHFGPGSVQLLSEGNRLEQAAQEAALQL